MSAGPDRWDPAQYNKFRGARMLPFFDLASHIEARPAMRVVDLGCGTGELTAMLAERLPGATVRGVDSSPAMLAEAASRASERVGFAAQDLLDELPRLREYDLVFTHAALQWVPDHERLFPRLLDAMADGAQIAVQMPNNYAHPSHAAAAEVARSEAFRERLGGFVQRTEVLGLERYAELFHAHGLRDAVCVEKIYGHEMARTEDVVEWVRGTLLTAYLARLGGESERVAFVDAYRARILATIGPRGPYFYPFRRMLLWGRKGAAREG